MRVGVWLSALWPSPETRRELIHEMSLRRLSTGLSVLPAAIDRDVLMACSATMSTDASRISIANVNERFVAENVEYTAGSRDGPILDPKAHSWVNYFKVGSCMVAYPVASLYDL